jgi:hypothetical protein
VAGECNQIFVALENRDAFNDGVDLAASIEKMTINVRSVG